ncbi:MAG: hypothetical protein AAF570_01880 [Bacteroidota bacterium]
MKAHLSFLIALMAFVCFSCQSDSVKPVPVQIKSVKFSQEGHNRPDLQCGSSMNQDLLNPSGAARGSIEVLNDDRDIYILAIMTQGWLIRSAKIFVGNSADLPRANGGGVEVEEFPYLILHSNPGSKFTYSIPTHGQPNCPEVAIQMQVDQVSFFGNVVASEILWADGAGSSSGKTFSFCIGGCGLGGTTLQNATE